MRVFINTFRWFERRRRDKNANGIRTSKTIGDTTHFYTLEGTKILREDYCGSTLIPLYDNSDEVCGIQFNGSPYFFQKNLQGDIIAITNASGEVTGKYEYDAWGKILSITDQNGTDISSNASHIANINPYRYRSYYYDIEIGMYYLQSRYYDPEVGRFVNGDDPNKLILSAFAKNTLDNNFFTYCLNNPVMYIDPDGHYYILIGHYYKYDHKQYLTNAGIYDGDFTFTTNEALSQRIDYIRVFGFYLWRNFGAWASNYTYVYKNVTYTEKLGMYMAFISDRQISGNKNDELKKMSEIDLLARTIYAEDTKSTDGQHGVALCISNRKITKGFHISKYGNSYKNVLLMTNAFETIEKPSKDALRPTVGSYKWEYAKELAARLILNYKMIIPTGYIGQLYFLDNSKNTFSAPSPNFLESGKIAILTGASAGWK